MQKRSTLPFVLTLATVALVAVMAWSLRYFGRYQPYAGLFSNQLGTVQAFVVQLDDVSVKGRHTGSPAWSFLTTRMTLTPDHARLVAEGIQNGVLIRDYKPFAKFAAGRTIYTSGAINADSGNLDVTGPIELTSTGRVQPLDASFRIRSTRALWNGATSELQCPDGVTASITKPTWPGPVLLTARKVTWAKLANSLHFTDDVRLKCPAPKGKGVIDIESKNVTWTNSKSLLTCTDTTRASGPLEGSSQPVTLASDGVTWDQSARTMTCTKPVNANLVLPNSNTSVQVYAKTAVWTPDNAHLAAPQAINVTVSRLGSFTCDTADVDTSSRRISFTRMRLAAQNTESSPPPAPAAAPDTAATPAPVDPNRVFVTAPDGGHWDEQQSTLVLRGPVKFTQGDATMTTVGAIYDRKASSAKGLAPVTITDPESTLTGQTGTIDFKRKVVTIDGKAHLTQVPKDAATQDEKTDDDIKNAAHLPTNLDCDKIVYDYKAKKAVATGHLTITQKHRIVTADVGHYDASTKIAQLTGNVVGKSDDGKVLKAPLATVSLKKGDEWLEFPTSVNFEFTPDDDDKAPPKTKK
ncbi:MAG TPA: hypothetical protein VGK19_15165 [Capsulimonadaceae bacterium]|jgi:hypothetical protein